MNKVIFIRENILMFLIIIFIFLLDRLSKIFMLNNLSENLIYINDFINFDLIWNTGIGFGLFKSNSSIFYNSISILIGLIILGLFYFSINSKKFDKIFLRHVLEHTVNPSKFIDEIKKLLSII